MLTKVWLKSLKGRDHLDDHGVVENIVLISISFAGVDWIHMAQYMGPWRAPVKTAMKLWVPQNAGNFLTSWL
jgi:hypothetical protein